ncbi:hypothetical protein NUSPORA_02302 [Nucleospora cyclopteri]
MFFLYYRFFYLFSIFCKENAVILILCRNKEKDQMSATIKNFEERFNKKYRYPYVFLNDEEFTDEFKRSLNEATNNNAQYGLVEPENWKMPENINKEKAKENWKKMAQAGIPYAEVESYHNMCRFFSKTFYKHPLVKDFEYYWRIEPGVIYHCDIDGDPFYQLKSLNKKYGFVITIREFMQSIETLMVETAKFLALNRDRLPIKNNLRFMFDNGKYNGCHFWSNFEIGSFEFFRSQLYNDYVDFLDSSGGFYYERWGDAPIHSIAVALFLDKSEVHFFDEIGYTHDAITHCPVKGKNCNCETKFSIDFQPYSCLNLYLNDIN